jgi:hypothetical protein
MAATYTFDVFFTLDGHGAYGDPLDWGQYLDTPRGWRAAVRWRRLRSRAPDNRRAQRERAARPVAYCYTGPTARI